MSFHVLFDVYFFLIFEVSFDVSFDMSYDSGLMCFFIPKRVERGKVVARVFAATEPAKLIMAHIKDTSKTHQ